jgi:hypothetical protein
MENVTYTLGQRILHAARMAVAVHLESVAESSSSRGQRVAIGRAGPQVVSVSVGSRSITDLSTDGRLPASGGREGGVARDDSSTTDAPSPSPRPRFAEGAD